MAVNLRIPRLAGQRAAFTSTRSTPAGLIAGLVCLLMAAGSLAAERTGSASLDEYLKRLGYVGIGWLPSQHAQPILTGKINGKKLGFLVDSGCSITLVNEETSKGLKRLGELDAVLKDSVFGAETTNASLLVIDELALGRAQFFNEPAKVKELRFDFIHTLYDAILGLDFLLRNCCLVDCKEEKLYVRGGKPSGQQVRALAETLRKSGFIEVEMDLKEWFAFTAVAQVNGEPVRLMIDTGSFVTVLHESQVSRFGLKPLRQGTTGSFIPAEMQGGMVGLGSIGKHKLRAVKVASLKLGSREWNNIPVGIGDLRAWGIERASPTGRELQGLLGIDMLRTQGALIDFASGKLWLRPVSKKAK